MTINDDEQAIRRLVTTWMSASKSGDLQTVLGLMSDDVVFMVPGREPFGKETFAAGSRAMQGTRIDGSSEIEELKILDGWAWMRNRLTLSITLPDGSTSRRSGYTLTILQKTPDGRWVLARDANLLAPDGQGAA